MVAIEPQIQGKPYRVYTVTQPGDVKDEWVGEGPTPDTAVQIACHYWSARQQVYTETGWVVGVWDESLGTPGTVVAFIGMYGKGQYPTG